MFYHFYNPTVNKKSYHLAYKRNLLSSQNSSKVEKLKKFLLDENSEEYENYFKLSKINISGRLFNTYDEYIKKKYEIDINYKALKEVKNYFN